MMPDTGVLANTSSTLHGSINLFKKTYSSSFRITIEGPILFLSVITSLLEKMESCLTSLTRLHHSQTPDYITLKQPWQTA